MQVLWIERDPTGEEPVADWLAREEFVVRRVWRATAGDVAEADVVVVGDTDEPISVCRRLRREVPRAKIVVLVDAARNEEALEAGADDVVPAGGSLRELALRLRAVGRRPDVPVLDDPEALVVRSLQLNLRDMRARIGATPLDLTPTQFRALTVLAGAAGQVVDRETLALRALGDPRTGARALDSVVKRLRRRLAVTVIEVETVRGVGYRLRVHPVSSR